MLLSMSSWFNRSCLALQVTSIGLIALALARLRSQAFLLESGQISVIAILFLGSVCLGFGLRVIRGWSTRLFWEWMFLSAMIFGGWLFPKMLFLQVIGSILALIVVCLPLSTKQPTLRLLAFLISAAGASVFLALYISPTSLWLLWVGLTSYDRWTKGRFEALVESLSVLEKKHGVLTSMPMIASEKVVILTSHITLPVALIVQATWRSLEQGLALLFALLIGAWYAMMRPVTARVTTLLPWVLVWMGGAELLVQLVTRLK